jgi:putative sterol carrier protein
VTDATAEFFADLASRGHEPALRKTTGTIRFDLKAERTTHWLVSIAKGDVDVSRKKSRADCVVHVDRELFQDISSGRANMLAAVLRGAIAVDGDAAMLLAFQRVFPGPQDRTS